jgi:hypothetical protein
VSGEASEWIASKRPLLVGADNLAWDVPDVVDPGTGITLPGHVHLLVRGGIYIVESLNLEALAADGARVRLRLPAAEGARRHRLAGAADRAGLRRRRPPAGDHCTVSTPSIPAARCESTVQ